MSPDERDTYERHGHGAEALVGSTDAADANKAGPGRMELPHVAPTWSLSGEWHLPREHAEGRGRVLFLDNLRTFVVFLVVLCHAGGVYESSGLWASFWIVDDPATNNLSGLINVVLDIFMMPTLFFISGYLAPASLHSRSAWAFIRTRFRRLIFPWLVGALVLLPLYKVIFLHSRGLPQQAWTTYFHWSNGIWGQNWLWFLPVLFAFHLLLLLLGKSQLPVPDISVKQALLGAFLIGFVNSMGMDLLGLRGWTKTPLLDFQNERLLIYFLAFLVGAACFQRKVFEGKPKRGAVYHVVNAVAWIPVTLYLIFLLYPWFKPGDAIVTPVADKVIVWFNFHVSLVCLMYVMIETFRRYQDRVGRLGAALSRNSYGVYVIHVIVLGGFALGLLDTSTPSLGKYVILTASTYATSQAIVYLYRKVMAILRARNAARFLEQTFGDRWRVDCRARAAVQYPHERAVRSATICHNALEPGGRGQR